MKICYRPIGTILSPFKELSDMPIQPAGASGIQGSVIVYPEFAEGLKDLDGFSHVHLLYHLHQVQEARLTLVPFLDSRPHGVFATRAPKRPNPIGLSVVRLLGIKGNVLQVENLDVLDGTPLLDIKPYVPEFDHLLPERTGWLEQAGQDVRTRRSDDRFR